jgi:glycerol-3-phosphate dehydrogenase
MTVLLNPPLPPTCDVLVVGGGINGVGVARDLAGQGLSVVLCEKDDLAAHTSSASSKLIHGGLRYLEYGEFGLVRKALAEREVLIKNAPHIMWPLRFVMPHDPSMRPSWLIRLGLFLYDHLALREMLPGSSRIDLRHHVTGQPLKPHLHQGFLYADGWADDARLVVLNALDAFERGATVLRGWGCVQARCEGALWHAQLQTPGQAVHALTARALVNATGPWASQFLSDCVAAPNSKTLRLVKGSHVVVPQLFDHGHAYIFQTPNKRIIFALPYEQHFTLIGTTDVDYHGSLGEAHIDDSEIAYLCEQASRYFEKPVRPAEVVWHYCGVRPLLNDANGDPSAVTRDYSLELAWSAPHVAPLLNIWGGKLTTFRKLAEEVVQALAGPLNFTPRKWTAHAPLPGGDLQQWVPGKSQPHTVFAQFLQAVGKRYPQLPEPVRHRLARAYGTRMAIFLDAENMGQEVAPGLFEAELNYLHQHEWARHADDVLWRRTKLGLHLNAQQREAVVKFWMKKFQLLM